MFVTIKNFCIINYKKKSEYNIVRPVIGKHKSRFGFAQISSGEYYIVYLQILLFKDMLCNNQTLHLKKIFIFNIYYIIVSSKFTWLYKLYKVPTHFIKICIDDFQHIIQIVYNM